MITHAPEGCVIPLGHLSIRVENIMTICKHGKY